MELQKAPELLEPFCIENRSKENTSVPFTIFSHFFQLPFRNLGHNSPINQKGAISMKRMISLCCAGLMAFSLAACGSQNATSSTSTPQVTSSVVGKITALDGTTATLQLGELTENQPSDPPSQDSTQPSGDNADGDSSTSSTQTPPEQPEGDNNTQGTGDSSSSTDAQNAPPSDGQGPAPDSTFTTGEEITTVDLSGAAVTKESQSGTTDASLSDLAVGDVIEVTMGEDNTATAVVIKSVGGAPDGSGSGEVDQGTSANTIDKDGEVSGTTYTSDGDDENALRVTGATATLNGVTVNKSSGASSNPGNGDFYGTNAALLATDGATVTIQDATITSNAQGGNGVFSYGKGTTVNLSDSTITAQKDNSGGIQTTGGGTTNATNLTVETNGNSSAAIRSDRGGGTVNVEKGTYTSKGYNSPAVYSTANITVKNAALTAENSEALVVEGKNSITLENCDVSGSMSDSKGTSSSENVHNVMIYQSMSGDAETGTANFSMTGGKLTSSNGDQFYVTNTDCNITLSGVTLVNKDKDGKLLRVTGKSASHGWGTAGKNGAQVTFAADAQTMEGDMEVDSISTLDLTLKNNSTFTGTIQIVDNADGGTAVENNAVVTIEKGSKWVLTGDCTITSLTNNGTIDFNGHTITLADGTVLKG